MLEFPAIRERLARHASFAAGREAALALRPVADRVRAVRRQRETAEAVRLRALRARLPLGGARDVRPAARAAARGRTLAPAELLEIAGLAGTAGRMRRALARLRAEAPLLGAIGAALPDLGALGELIAAAIGDRGEVRDSASPALAAIRRERDAVHGRLLQRMEALARSAALRPALQEQIVTLRGGRYVLPVRAEARGAVPGVVHDSSASGATIYVEPLAAVDAGNRRSELQARERHETERILRELSEAAGQAADELAGAVERLARIDLALAKARLAEEIGATALAAADPGAGWLAGPPEGLRLVGARHPLLGAGATPITIEAGGGSGAAQALLITGPNTGGKTVALKTAGLLCLMALAGLPLPAAEGTRVPAYDAIFADIGDEQSIEQSLSTFSGHMTAIIDVIERAGPRSLVLLDELGAGTDPAEGSALAIAIVERLLAGGATLVATTHHGELKLYAQRRAGVRNASVEFDAETLAPTYRLRIGVPGQSNAIAIAERLGMPDAIVAAARAGVPREQRDLERVLGDLRAQLAAAEDRAARAAADRDAAEALRGELERRLAALAGESDRMRAEARERVRAEVRHAERLLRRTRREVESARLEQAGADLERARAAAAALAPDPPPDPAPPAPPPDSPRAGAAALPAPEPGSRVWLRGIAAPGEALDAPDAAGEFGVQLGALRTRVRLPQVERIEQPDGAVFGAVRLPQPPQAPEQLEVRGQAVAEALPAVEAFLDAAARSGRGRVRIVHGKGTGALRRAVRELLGRHPLVTAYESGSRHEGGEGVTAALLAAAR